MSKAQQERDEKDEAVTALKKILKPGDVVYTVLRHVASSGMSRRLDVYTIQDNRPRWLTSLVSTACGYSRYKGHGPLVVGGVGMDMGFAVTYDLARVVFRDGFKCTGTDRGRRRCPSNDHANERHVITGYDRKRVHSDPGYALQHEWL